MKPEARKPTTAADKTQHGDPPPKTRDPSLFDICLSPEEKARLARGLPQQTGPIAMPKRCGWCGKGLPATASYCDDCAPNGKPVEVGGSNLGQWRVPTEKR